MPVRRLRIKKSRNPKNHGSDKRRKIRKGLVHNRAFSLLCVFDGRSLNRRWPADKPKYQGYYCYNQQYVYQAAYSRKEKSDCPAYN
jgi:hypothetical protein